ncbi:argininosuccinate lyase [Hydra vulgaris]|uniref:Argininosuccinate lyase n=1 Tax=Hydra vulgaris TaxID=6087 RepID=A0ABM4CT56_HYDVU
MIEDDSVEKGKLWGGRFTSKVHPDMNRFNSSINIDKRLWEEDLLGSVAYAKGLVKVGLLTEEEGKLICEGLDTVATEWCQDKFILKPSVDEDIHTANERRLKELIGDVAGKLHTGRSRNDQVATDTRLWLRKEILKIKILLIKLIKTFQNRAEKEIDILMAGYTHLQRAQPIRWSQWLMSHAWSFKYDADRLTQLCERVNVSPLGCGALAGNPFGIDREFLADELGCISVTDNSLHSVGNRDFIIEFMFWSSLVMIHFSNWAEDLIIFNTKEFNFITLADAFSTGSSLMPHKKNPDSLELIRGKCGRIFGNFSGLMMTCKGLPSSYNKDLQEDKECLFDTVDKLKEILTISRDTLESLTLNEKKCHESLDSSMLSTDLAYYLVRKGLPFREAHEIAGKAVILAEKKGVALNSLTLNDLATLHGVFDIDIEKVWDYESSVNQYTSTGGTSKIQVSKQIQKLQSWLLQV